MVNSHQMITNVALQHLRDFLPDGIFQIFGEAESPSRVWQSHRAVWLGMQLGMLRRLWFMGVSYQKKQTNKQTDKNKKKFTTESDLKNSAEEFLDLWLSNTGESQVPEAPAENSWWEAERRSQSRRAVRACPARVEVSLNWHSRTEFSNLKCSQCLRGKGQMKQTPCDEPKTHQDPGNGLAI